MKRLLAEGLLLTLLLAAVLHAWDQRQRAEEEVARSDSIRTAWRDSSEVVRERVQEGLTLWRDSTAFYRQQTAELESELDSLDRDFTVTLDDLIATADTGGTVTLPKLRELQRTHIEVVQRCKLALKSCRSEVRTVENRLSIFRDTILPTVDSLNAANARLNSDLRDLARPDFIARVGRNLELVVVTAILTGGAVCLATC